MPPNFIFLRSFKSYDPLKKEKGCLFQLLSAENKPGQIKEFRDTVFETMV